MFKGTNQRGVAQKLVFKLVKGKERRNCIYCEKLSNCFGYLKGQFTPEPSMVSLHTDQYTHVEIFMIIVKNKVTSMKSV